MNELINLACDDALEVIFGHGLFGDENDVLAALPLSFATVDNGTAATGVRLSKSYGRISLRRGMSER